MSASGIDSAPEAGPPERSNTKRGSRLVKLRKDRPGEDVGTPVTQSIGRGPQQKRVTRRPDLAEPRINGIGYFIKVQNLRKRTGVNEDKKPSDDKDGCLGVYSGRTVWVDGPTLWSFMFGSGDAE